MASVRRKKKKIGVMGRCPAYNVYAGRRGRGDDYAISVELVEDDSPILRAAIRLHRAGTPLASPAATAIFIPLVFLDTLREKLDEFIPAAREELSRRGEKRVRFK